jgi:hypothetical protein
LTGERRRAAWLCLLPPAAGLAPASFILCGIMKWCWGDFVVATAFFFFFQ